MFTANEAKLPHGLTPELLEQLASGSTLHSLNEISKAAKELAANINELKALGCYAANLYAPSPRHVAQQLSVELNGKGHTLKIEWKWNGRNRHGVVNIINRAGSCIYSGEYPRSETRWDENDELLTSCNRGSNKHLALIAALAFIRTLPRRRCGVISDSLVS
jgi:hypothetical protein